jgi:hypothetical protein
LQLVDQLEHALPGQYLFAHPSPMEAQLLAYGQDHSPATSAIFTLLTRLVVYANVPAVVGGLNQFGSQGGFRQLREAT